MSGRAPRQHREERRGQQHHDITIIIVNLLVGGEEATKIDTYHFFHPRHGGKEHQHHILQTPSRQ